MRWTFVFIIIGIFLLKGSAQKDLEGIPDSLIDSYHDYKWYDRSSIFGGVVYSNFNSKESIFSSPLSEIPTPGFEIGFNIVQRSEKYYQFKVGGSFQRLRLHENLDINGTLSRSQLNLNAFNVHVTPLIISIRKKLMRTGLGLGAYGSYILAPNNTLDNEAAPFYNKNNTKEYDYGFQIQYSFQYHYFFIEAKWMNGISHYYEAGDMKKKFGILGISFNLLLP